MIIDENHELAEAVTGAACFQCGGLLQPPIIQWHGDDEEGNTVNLVFHPRCALHFALRFMRDVHELDLDSHLSYPQAVIK